MSFHARHLLEAEERRRRYERGEIDETPKQIRSPRELAGEGGNMSVIGWREARLSELLRDGIVLRMRGEKLRESASFADLAAAVLAESGRPVAEGQHPIETIRLAMHTVHDFPGLLGTAAERVFLPTYETAPAVSRRCSGTRTLNSLRDVDFIRPAEFPPLLEIGAGGEYEQADLVIDAESGRVAKYGRTVGLAEELMLANDAGGFGELMRSAAGAVVEAEEALFWGYVTSGSGGNGPTLSDGAQLFATGGKTLASSGAAISTTSIGVGIADMAEQATPTGRKGVASPRWLVCPPSLLGLAQVELSKMQPAADPAHRITPVASPHLTGAAWYLFADASPALARLSLSYWPRPKLDTRYAQRVDGLEIKVSHQFGTVATGRVGIWKNAGA